jgi:fumarate reductase flavoprotein subunit
MYSIFDDELREDVEVGRIIDEVHKADTKGKTHPGLKEKLQKLAESGGAKISDSWEEIARWMGAKPEVMQAEIDAYNAYCAQGRDEIFARNPDCMRPLRTPPYYAMRCYSSVTETLGGIKVNERMEVQNKQGDPIPGVYAAGAIADGCHGQTYCLDVAGTTMGFAINSGRIAGESAAKFVLS